MTDFERQRFSLPVMDSELPGLTNSPVAPETVRGRRVALAVVLVLSFLTVAYIASSLWVGIAIGTVMAFTAQPSYRTLVAHTGNRRQFSAAVMTLAFGLIGGVIGGLALYVITRELLWLVSFLQAKLASGSLSELVGERPARLLDHMGVHRAQLVGRIRQEMSTASDYAATAAGVVLQATTSAILSLFVALLTMYYVLLNWPRIAVRLERVLPLDPRHTRALVIEFRDVGRSSFVGTVATALVQGTFAGVGYAMASVPQPVTFGLFTAIASFIPLIGTALLWIPVSLYLLFEGRGLAAIFVLTWGFLIVMALSDYVIRPRLVGSRGHGHPLLTLVALLGGIEVFGLAGLFVGPILMALFLAVLRIYERELSFARAESMSPIIEEKLSG